MTVSVAINGFGRIGRLVLRAIAEEGRSDLVPTRINASTSMNMDSVAHLFAYDSAHGRFAGQVEVSGNALTIRHNGKVYGPIPVTFERDPTKLDLSGTDVALECTGKFTSKEKCAPLLAAGAKKVLISAPGDGVDAMIVYGVNNHALTPDMKVISAASCTTNCLAPMVKVLNDRFGILRGYMVTIHAFTNDQNTLDGSHRDLRRARTATASAIPTSTGAARSIGQVIPELKGKLDGTAIRIPVQNVSIVSLDVNLAKPATKDEINAAMQDAAKGELRGVMDYNTAPLVGIDFNHTAASCTFDATQTAVVDGALTRVMGWYDNEWGFSCRMLDLAALMGGK
jgi:glyceraldehyde 3-phosphate dehydrogenase